MTASYWEVGRRIVEAERKGRRRAAYGEQLMERLSADLTARFGRGFDLSGLAQIFTLPWPAYVRLMAANYRTVLPDAELLQKELENTRRLLESRATLPLKDDRQQSCVPPSGLRAAPRASRSITAIRR